MRLVSTAQTMVQPVAIYFNFRGTGLAFIYCWKEPTGVLRLVNTRAIYEIESHSSVSSTTLRWPLIWLWSIRDSRLNATKALALSGILIWYELRFQPHGEIFESKCF